MPRPLAVLDVNAPEALELYARNLVLVRPDAVDVGERHPPERSRLTTASVVSIEMSSTPLISPSSPYIGLYEKWMWVVYCETAFGARDCALEATCEWRMRWLRGR